MEDCTSYRPKQYGSKKMSDMATFTIDALADTLARNRAAGRVTDLPMSMIRSREEANALQAAALEAFDSDFRGYALIGTSRPARSMLGLRGPVAAAIPDKAFHEDVDRFTLPRGMVGAQCEMVLTIGGTYPMPGEAINRFKAAEVVLACRPAIGLLGRRTPPGADSDLIAVADFGFHVATIPGPAAHRVDPMGLDRLEMVARIDGRVVARAHADAVLGHPLEAVAWLARRLAAEGKRLSAGDVVATGSCSLILQVLPNQLLTVEFEELGTVSCRFG